MALMLAAGPHAAQEAEGIYTAEQAARGETLYEEQCASCHAGIRDFTPGMAAQHLRKIECFCFELQRLEAGEEMEMPVTFFVSNELPEEIETLSLSYTLFRVQQTARLATDRDQVRAAR